MDIRDSPLRGLLNSPVKRVTPAVPTPDWTASSVPQNVASPLTSPVISRYNVPSPVIRNTSRQSCIQTPGPLSSPDPNSLRSSVISCSPSTSLKRNHSDEIYRPEDSSWYPPQNGEAESQSKQAFYPERLTHTPVQNRISGDVVLTPTHSAFTPSQPNPHQLMVPQTPIPSEPNQAKNSIKLQNCVSTVNLNCELKLLDVYCRTRFSEYNPSRFHGVVMRILNPRATALVFKSGKLVCTGARNEHDSLLATKKFARIIQKLGFPVRFTEFKIQNFVATADLRFPVRLEALQQSHGQFTSYEPELFPGLIYRMVRPRIVLLIFVNGKIVFTGAKSREDITESLTIIYPILRSFRKN